MKMKLLLPLSVLSTFFLINFSASANANYMGCVGKNGSKSYRIAFYADSNTNKARVIIASSENGLATIDFVNGKFSPGKGSKIEFNTKNLPFEYINRGYKISDYNLKLRIEGKTGQVTYGDGVAYSSVATGEFLNQYRKIENFGKLGCSVNQ